MNLGEGVGGTGRGRARDCGQGTRYSGTAKKAQHL